MRMEDKAKIYQKAKLGGKIGMGKRPAIVVIDLQKAFLPSAPAGADMTSTIKAVNRLTEEARKKDIKVYYTRVGYSRDGIDAGLWAHKIWVIRDFTRDSEYYEMDDRLKIKADDVIIEKHWASAFLGTHLLPMLVATNIDTLIVTGWSTAGGVYATAVDSCSHGFRTIIVSEGVADRTKETHEMFLWNMGQKYGDVMSDDEVISGINKLDRLEYPMMD